MRNDPRPSLPFRYAADPVCVTVAILYVLNRFFLKPHDVGGVFTASYLNDMLCLPLFVPISLCIQRILGLRGHDGPPRAWEIAQHWLVFSMVFELVIPRFSDTFRSTADPLDTLAYLAGGVIAWTVWSRRRRDSDTDITIIAPAHAVPAGSGTVAK